MARITRFRAAIAGLIACIGLPVLADAPIIAAASDLKFALEEVAQDYRDATGQEVDLVFGSTGNFAQQIRQGAPFQIFMAADERFVLDLSQDGFTVDDGTLYAEGRLALLRPKGAVLAMDDRFADLAAALTDGRINHFAIANPEHAPYGQRAKEALEQAGLWALIGPKLVLGENVAQAAQFVTSGNAEAGIVAYALVLAPALAAQVDYDLIPATWHQPLLQRMALIKGATPEAAEFYTYLQGPAARMVLERYGFRLPQGG